MMNKILCIALLFSIALSACASPAIDSQHRANLAADRRMSKYCSENARDCAGLKHTETTELDSKWLVEYSSSNYMFAVIVKANGDSEISREPKELYDQK